MKAKVIIAVLLLALGASAAVAAEAPLIAKVDMLAWTLREAISHDIVDGSSYCSLHPDFRIRWNQWLTRPHLSSFKLAKGQLTLSLTDGGTIIIPCQSNVKSEKAEPIKAGSIFTLGELEPGTVQAFRSLPWSNRLMLGQASAKHHCWVGLYRGCLVLQPKYFRAAMTSTAFDQALAKTVALVNDRELEAYGCQTMAEVLWQAGQVYSSSTKAVQPVLDSYWRSLNGDVITTLRQATL